MKRDFKAISVETEKWVYGLPFSMDFSGKVTHIQAGAHFYAIKPETLSECTGRKDVKGTKIYENDILLLSDLDLEEECIKETHHLVFYDDELAQFRTREIRNDEESFTEDLKISDDHDYGFTVIGNIFDNPELLKVDDGADERPEYLDGEHCCDYNADGMCEICGALRPGSPLYLEIYGGE